MLARLAADALNHLLTQNDWARKQLLPHAGAHLRFLALPWRADLRVSPLGFLLSDERPDAAEVSPDLTLSLPLSALPLAVIGAETLVSRAQLAGRAELAEAVGILLRELRWDAEDDLAPWLGDLGARRAVRVAAQVRDELRDVSARLQGATRDFVAHDSDSAVPRAAARQRQEDLAALRREVDTLARRVDRVALRHR